jgi:hypothetical protein
MKDRDALRESWRNQFYVCRGSMGVRIRGAYYRVTGRCGECTFIYAACNRKRRHATDGSQFCEYHAETRHGRLWAEWR